MRSRAWLLLFAWLLFVPTAGAAVPAAQESNISADIEVYVREGCPHCADAEVFLARLQNERPELRVRYHPIDRDFAARERLALISRKAGAWPPGVPTFVLGDTVLVGFDDAEHSGRILLDLLGEGEGDARTGGIDSRWFGTLDASELGLPLFTLAIGLLDGFNPCAMWILLFLLALLVRLHDRRRMALIAGTFVLVGGALYYAFLAAWLNLFLAIGLSAPIRWTLGLVALLVGAINVKDFVAWGHGPSLSIPDSAKPGLYARARRVMTAPSLATALLAVALLAILVNFVELLCTAGFPAMYTAVLAQHDLSRTAYHGYLALYVLGYITDDALMVGLAVTALATRKLSERVGRWLKLISGVVMLLLALLLLFRPDWIL